MGEKGPTVHELESPSKLPREVGVLIVGGELESALMKVRAMSDVCTDEVWTYTCRCHGIRNFFFRKEVV